MALLLTPGTGQSLLSKVAERREQLARARAKKARKDELIRLGELKREELKRKRISGRRLEDVFDRRTNAYRRMIAFKAAVRAEREGRLGRLLTALEEDNLDVLARTRHYLETDDVILLTTPWYIGTGSKKRLRDDVKFIRQDRQGNLRAYVRLGSSLGVQAGPEAPLPSLRDELLAQQQNGAKG